jgi:hypothetical protein
MTSVNSKHEALLDELLKDYTDPSYCQELCMPGSCGVLFYPDAVLEGPAVHDLRQVMRGS